MNIGFLARSASLAHSSPSQVAPFPDSLSAVACAAMLAIGMVPTNARSVALRTVARRKTLPPCMSRGDTPPRGSSPFSQHCPRFRSRYASLADTARAFAHKYIPMDIAAQLSTVVGDLWNGRVYWKEEGMKQSAASVHQMAACWLPRRTLPKKLRPTSRMVRLVVSGPPRCEMPSQNSVISRKTTASEFNACAVGGNHRFGAPRYVPGEGRLEVLLLLTLSPQGAIL